MKAHILVFLEKKNGGDREQLESLSPTENNGSLENDNDNTDMVDKIEIQEVVEINEINRKL